MKKIILSLILAIALSACATLSSFLPIAIGAIQEAALILDQVQSASDNWFAARPNADAQGKINQAITAVRLTLSILNNAAQGASEQSDGNYQAAILQYQTAFSDLLDALGEIGIIDEDKLSRDIAISNGAQIPMPRLMRVQVSP